MKKYYVSVKVVYYECAEMDAETEQDAIDMYTEKLEWQYANWPSFEELKATELPNLNTITK
jgi:hypothetical protein